MINVSKLIVFYVYLFEQLFKREFVDAVLQEWYKTMSNLPAGLRQAHEMVLNYLHSFIDSLSFDPKPWSHINWNCF
jgi:hypothetical protein